MNEGNFKAGKHADKNENAILDTHCLDNNEFLSMLCLARTQDSLDPDTLSNLDIDETHNQGENERALDSAQSARQSAQTQMMEMYLSLQETETKIYLNKIIGFFFTMVLSSTYLLLMISFNFDAYNMFTIFIIYLAYFGMFEVLWAPELLNEIWRDSDDFYKLGDIVSLLIFIVVVILRLNHIISVCFHVCVIFLFPLMIYWWTSPTAPKDQIWEYLARSYYLMQALMISFKIDGFLSLTWTIIFIPSWIYFGLLSFFFIKSLQSLFLRLIRDHISSPNFKAIGFLWHLSSRSSILSLLFGIAGFSHFQTPGSDFKFLSYTSYTILLLNIGLLVVTITKRQIIIKFIMTFRLIKSNVLQYAPEELIEAGEKMKKISFESQVSTTYFLMISSTYFFPLNQIYKSKKKDIINKVKLLLPNPNSKSDSIEQTKTATSTLKSNDKMHLNSITHQDSEEKYLCYVCCKNSPNVIFSNCGHGGICYDCSIASVKQKDECLQCRCKIYAIHIIDPDQKMPHIVKSMQLYKVIKT